MKKLSALMLVLVGCADRSTVIGAMTLDSGSGDPDAGAASGLPWGAFAAALPVGPCLDGGVLMVDTVADELEGGEALSSPTAAGAHLSFAEALWIAQNTPGPDTILFDAAVFPVEARGTILLRGSYALPQSLANTCIDARNRGVVVHWSHSARTGAPSDSAFLFGLGMGSLQIGLELRAIEQGQSVNQAQVAGCRYFSEDGDYEHPVSNQVTLNEATFGPGNVILGLPVGVMGSGTVRGNFIGYDPRTGQNAPPTAGVVLLGPSLVEKNVISAIFQAAHIYSDGTIFRDNVIGFRPDTLAELNRPIDGVRITNGFARAMVGPGNHIKASNAGVYISSAESVTITRTLITARQPIENRDFTPPVAAPEIVAAGPAQVSGTCSVEGLIEVFSGSSFAVNEFIGEATCGANRTWTLVAKVPSTSVLATLTDAQGSTSLFSTPFIVP